MEVYIETFSVRSTINNLCITLDPIIKKNNNKLVVNVDNEIQAMSYDITKLRQNLFNLLGNAAKFSEGKEILNDVSLDKKLGADPIFFSRLLIVAPSQPQGL